MSHLQRYPLWKTCWKHKAFSIPLYQTKVEHESKKKKSTLWWRWITSTYSSSYSLEGVLYSCFLTWGIWTVQVISLPTFHGSIQFNKRLTAHPAHQRVSAMENNMKKDKWGFGKRARLTIVLSILWIRRGRGIIYSRRTATVQNLIEPSIRRICYPFISFVIYPPDYHQTYLEDNVSGHLLLPQPRERPWGWTRSWDLLPCLIIIQCGCWTRSFRSSPGSYMVSPSHVATKKRSKPGNCRVRYDISRVISLSLVSLSPSIPLIGPTTGL